MKRRRKEKRKYARKEAMIELCEYSRQMWMGEVVGGHLFL